MAAGISTRNRATMEKSSLFVEVEGLCGAKGYPLRTPRLKDTVLDAHTREPITVITERYLGGLRFFRRWSQPGHNQKLAHLIPEIRVERSHLMFCTNYHKINITTGYYMVSRARSLRNLLVSGNECGRVFPAGVGPGSPSRDAANWLPSRFSLSVETRRRYGWLRMMVFPGARLFPSPNLVPFGRVAARERQGALSRRAW